MAVESFERGGPELPAQADSGHPPDRGGAHPAVQDFYPEYYAHCFGCGRLNPTGLHVRSVEEGDDLVARIPPCRDEVARPGIAFAGHIVSLLDCHAVAAAALAAHRARGREMGDGPVAPFMTASMKVDHVRPTPAGVPYELRARALFVQGHKVIVKVELRAGSLVCARAEVHAVEIPGTPGGARRLK
ncbi:MAG TPA: hotdog domain-containing protein [Candidatus Thermoplasmatota archaeon]